MGIHDDLDWTIRPAVLSDAPALALVAQATFLESYAALTTVEDMLAHGEGANSKAWYATALAQGTQIWIAEADGTRAPLGFAVLSASTLENALPGDIELKRIYVLGRCHGQGLARALLETAIAAGAGHSRLVLGVNRDNERAQAFYRKHGFALAGTRTFTVGSTTYDDFIYAKPLDQA